MSLLPIVPGIPPLLSAAALSIANATNTVVLLAADAAIVARLLEPSKWGIYLNGQPIAQADAVKSLEYKQDSKVSDYPQEQGAFQSYNKVASPYDARVQLVKGGTELDRAQFLAAIDAAAASLDLYDIATPERTYKNANVQRISYERKAHDGSGLITVEIALIEVRTTVDAAFTHTVKPGAQAQFYTGTVQSAISSAKVKLGLGSGM